MTAADLPQRLKTEFDRVEIRLAAIERKMEANLASMIDTNAMLAQRTGRRAA